MTNKLTSGPCVATTDSRRNVRRVSTRLGCRPISATCLLICTVLTISGCSRQERAAGAPALNAVVYPNASRAFRDTQSKGNPVEWVVPFGGNLTTIESTVYFVDVALSGGGAISAVQSVFFNDQGDMLLMSTQATPITGQHISLDTDGYTPFLMRGQFDAPTTHLVLSISDSGGPAVRSYRCELPAMTGLETAGRAALSCVPTTDVPRPDGLIPVSSSDWLRIPVGTGVPSPKRTEGSVVTTYQFYRKP